MRAPRFALWACLWLAASQAVAQAGITDTTITLGQSAPLTGAYGDTGQQWRDGARAYFEHVNARDGVHGRKLMLETRDDAAEPERALANTKMLVQDEGVLALSGYVGVGSAAAALPLVTQAGIPFLAPSSGAPALRQPMNKNVFHVRAS